MARAGSGDIFPVPHQREREDEPEGEKPGREVTAEEGRVEGVR